MTKRKAILEQPGAQVMQASDQAADEYRVGLVFAGVVVAVEEEIRRWRLAGNSTCAANTGCDWPLIGDGG